MTIGYPKDAPEDKTAPKCIVQQTLVYIRLEKYRQYDAPFGTNPAYWGSRLDCVEWAKERGTDLKLPVIEIYQENPNLRARDFEPPAVYLVHEKFDQWSPNARGRIFRY
jgi:hypothetical protein